MMSSRCPRPMGIMESMALMPVCRGVDTLCLSMIPGASASTGLLASPNMGPLPSIGSPRGFTTLPKKLSPTGIERTVPVRLTLVPSLMSFLSERIATETVSFSRFWASPTEPSSNSSSSVDMQLRSPYTEAMPSPTNTTVPTSPMSTRVL